MYENVKKNGYREFDHSGALKQLFRLSVIYKDTGSILKESEYFCDNLVLSTGLIM